jgi:hypothetical protein
MQMDLARCGVNQVTTPYNFGDLLFAVIDNYRQLVGKQSVSAPDHEIPDFRFQMLGQVTEYAVGEADRIIVSANANGTDFTAAGNTLATGPG